MCTWVQVPGKAKRQHDMKLQVGMNCSVWVLGTELVLSTRAVSAFNHWTVSLALFSTLHEPHAFYEPITSLHSLWVSSSVKYSGCDCSRSTLYVGHVWEHVCSVASYTIHRSMKSCQFLWKQSYTQHKEEHTAFVKPITISSWSHKLQVFQQNIQ